MAKTKTVKQTAVLHYPEHWFEPEDLLSFIELSPFERRWAGLGLTDKDLQALQVMLMTRPNSGEVMGGTGGLRKVRFSPSKWPTGKSGALRVCYSYMEEGGVIVLALVYAKNEMDDVPEAAKPILAAAVERVKKHIRTQTVRIRNMKSPA